MQSPSENDLRGSYRRGNPVRSGCPRHGVCAAAEAIAKGAGTHHTRGHAFLNIPTIPRVRCGNPG
ncbi:MAG: hypothetical protein KDL87_17085, partial [Verrucomicrobiae bacterium]|nr:hypothetical protein [Verrucomicrobiae bacterium]